MINLLTRKSSRAQVEALKKTKNNLQKLRQVEKRKRGCSPDITLLMQCLTLLENLLLCGKVLSYHLIIIVSLGFEMAWEGERGF